MKAIRSQFFIACFLVCCFAVFITGAPAARAAEKCKKTKYVTISNGVATASTMMVAAKWAEVMSKEIPCVTASATTGSFVANALTVNQKRHTIGIADPNTLYYTSRGVIKKFKGKETKNLRFINAMHHGAFHIFTRKDSPIKSVKDIATYPCRNVMVVSKLGATYQWVSRIFKAYGSSFEDLEKRGGSLAYVNYTNAIGLMKDGQADILLIHTPAPSSVILDIDSNPGVRFLEMEPEIRQKLTKMIPGMVEVTIPGGTYKNMPKDYKTIGVYFHNFTHKDISEEFIYNATKVFWKHEKDFQQLAAWGSGIQLKTALRGMNIPIHPGAERYYKEIGAKIPNPNWPW
ncbi:MAG: TAXI family TRAP transporter solute-binding subunit [Deltaproteobacteria bacterium]|nr:TAXI family TRAP transporter solute-binding subunit [Deltaproteobacteria bacterium]